MKYCTKCLMPDTKTGVFFDKKGVCQACRNFEQRKTTDWDVRKTKLKKLCDSFRREDGRYDCLIPVSGGKDSHYLVHTMKFEMGMNPLLITVGDWFTKSAAGQHNYENLSKAFGCDHITFNLSFPLFIKVARIGFEELCNPLLFLESAIHTIPIKLAYNYRIPFIIYGEDGAYEYGSTNHQNGNALPFIQNIFSEVKPEFWIERGISKKELNTITPLLEKDGPNNIKAIFLSYYYPWSSVTNYSVATQYGFKALTHEWRREGCVEDFEQIDSLAYLVHIWLKYPKFGYQRASDIISRRIREGLIGIEEGKYLIMMHDHKLDRRALDDFINVLDYSHKEFWDIVERFWNRKIFQKVNGVWQLKNPVYRDLLQKKSNLANIVDC